ncbi:Gp138 family membrane-puncturing spike protein, partial [Alicyclobacillus suci]|uniref:Gp138 family membrane-puncturing spike protein n=1 Tax=Alicyclobacillus suci TaxID=2816080 RepID=UPI001A8EC2CB
EQTVTVQPSIRERIQDPTTKEYSWVSLPLLVDVPLIIPRAGGYALTLPVSKGDECFVVFGDMCIDAWWANGGVQNQADKRRHDLSDGFAILAPTSQPKRLSNYSTTSAQLRTEDGSKYIELSSGGITIKGDVTVDGSITATGTITGES